MQRQVGLNLLGHRCRELHLIALQNIGAVRLQICKTGFMAFPHLVDELLLRISGQHDGLRFAGPEAFEILGKRPQDLRRWQPFVAEVMQGAAEIQEAHIGEAAEADDRHQKDQEGAEQAGANGDIPEHRWRSDTVVW